VIAAADERKDHVMTEALHAELAVAALEIVPVEQKREATELLTFVSGFVDGATAIVIVDDLTFAQAGERLREIKTVSKRIETVRTTMKAPVLEAGKKIDSFFRGPAGKLADAESTLKKRISTYQAEQERKQREAEEAARIERERIAAEATRSAAEGSTEEPPFEDAEPPPAPIATKLQGVSTRKVVKARVDDLRAIVAAAAGGNAEAYALLTISTSAIHDYARRHTVADGTVPGVFLFEETEVAARSL
jgi:hypothetical protein